MWQVLPGAYHLIMFAFLADGPVSLAAAAQLFLTQLRLTHPKAAEQH